MAGPSHPIPGIRREGMAVVPSALSAAEEDVSTPCGDG
jgi:hypothetical protein